MGSYLDGTKPESLVLHMGHNAIDQGTDGKKAADRMGDLVSKCSTEFKPKRLLYAKINKLKKDYTEGTRTTMRLMLVTKKSTALLTKLEANSSGPMYTSSIMVLRQRISDKRACTQTCMEFNKKVTTLWKHMKNIGYNCSSNDISFKQKIPKQQNASFLAFKRGWNNFKSPNEF